MSSSHACWSPWMQPWTRRSSSLISTPSLQKHWSMSGSLSRTVWLPAMIAAAAGAYISGDFMSIPILLSPTLCCFGLEASEIAGPNLRPQKREFLGFGGDGSLLTDTRRDWNGSDAQRNGKTEEVCFKSSDVAAEARRNRHRGPDTEPQEGREERKNPGKDKKHSRLKQHGNDMHFNVACADWKVVQAVKLHKRRKHGQKHDQDEHDFWQLMHCLRLMALTRLDGAAPPRRVFRRLGRL